LIDHDNLDAFADAEAYDIADPTDTGGAFYRALAQEAGGSVLEIGCGTGTTALRLAHRVRRLHATDVSSQMVAIAQEKIAATPVAQLDFAVLDAAGAAQQAPQAYDVVLAFNVLGDALRDALDPRLSV